jgi:glycosyltransferase involved in cell wall biosynthesis
LRVVIVDYSGHAFPAQLSRELAKRGYVVLHLHFADFLSPKGRLTVGPQDPPTLTIETIKLDSPFAKYSLFRRRFQEVEIGRRIANRIDAFGPAVVVGCNLPLDALDQVLRRSRSSGWAFVFWQQDIYSTAIRRILAKRLGPLGHLLGLFYRRIERRALTKSDAVIVIADDFLDALSNDFKISRDNVHVIENWAPLDEIELRPKANAWSNFQRLAHSEVVLYSGTLGLKHDASKLLATAEALRDRPNTVVVVVSEGLSANWLADEAARKNLANLKVLPFQPFEAYPDTLASADVLVAILEADAGAFSVPSKVLSYLCASRPVVLSAPPENLAFRIVEKSGAGRAVSVDESQAFVEAVRRFLDDRQLRQSAGLKGRQYAEKEFGIVKICDRFEQILIQACETRRRTKPRGIYAIFARPGRPAADHAEGR